MLRFIIFMSGMMYSNIWGLSESYNSSGKQLEMENDILKQAALILGRK